VKIYNSLTRQKQDFKPLNGNKVGFYACGMTVYDLCHLGHARTMVGFDVAVRYLRNQGYEVTYVRNITDIDDKIIQRALENSENPSELVDRMIHEMHADFAQLKLLKPDQEPRATEHVDGIIEMVQRLIEKGFAYAASNGDVYYAVRAFEGYGKLSGRQLDELQAGARIEIEEQKRDPLDFALWKAAKPEEPAWESPWGLGRPGWHIECSVMSTCCLGEHFDIHGGGADLKFPHHENEIAQSEAATGKPYVNTWMHCGPLRIDNEKMSKSLGNYFTIREILETYDEEIVRFMLVSSHYRSAMNYSIEALQDAQQKLERFYHALRGVSLEAVKPASDNAFEKRFHDAMQDDFNTPEALAVLFDMVREINKLEGSEKASLAAQLRQLGGILGCLQSDPERFLRSGVALDEAYIQGQIEARNQAKSNKNFAEADHIRDQLLAQGIVLQDSREGTTWVKA
jgi:cysteinyl-tRNA synthetase